MKIIGYIISIIGLAIIALSKKISEIPGIKSISDSSFIILIFGTVLVAVGIGLLLFNKKNLPEQKPEVPIYEGEGKKRKIVGYQRISKK